MLIVKAQDVGRESGSDGVDKVSQPHHSSGPDTSQYTFVHVGAQASASETIPRRAGDTTGHHGWQPVLMTKMMWTASVGREFLLD